MNAFLNTDASCAALLSSWLSTKFTSTSSSDPEVKRLQSLAQLGVDIYQAGLQLEENKMRIAESEARMRQIADNPQLIFEQHMLFQQCKELTIEQGTLSKAVNILTRTSEGVEQKVLIQRMQRVMQETITRHDQLQHQSMYGEDTTAESLLGTFEKMSEDVQTYQHTLAQMSTSSDILAAADVSSSTAAGSALQPSSEFLAWKNDILATNNTHPVHRHSHTAPTRLSQAV
jgi:hypothetical protein